MKKVSILFLIVFSLSFISATGLEISESSLNLNKTNGENLFVTLNITNTESFEIYNITFDKYLKADKFNLNAGESKSIEFKIDTNQNINEQIRLMGEYYANLGASNQTTLITISYPDGADKCNLNIVKGDKLIWNNQVSGQVRLKNTNTGEYFANIGNKENYSETYNDALNFDYKIYYSGIPLGSQCNINVQDTSGLVHNSEHDALINLNLKINYPETTLEKTIYIKNYTLNVNELSNQEVIKLKNTGSQTAKNINLEARWTQFSKNNFDLQVGEETTITYTIRPQLTETSETNKTHEINLSVSGNFETLTDTLTVFVNYKNLNNTNQGGFTYEPEFFENIFNLFCNANPENKICARYNESINYQGNVSFEYGSEDWRDWLLGDADFKNEVLTVLSEQSEGISQNTNRTSITLNEAEKTQEDTSKISESLKDIKYLFMGLGLILLGLVVLLLKLSGLKSNTLNKFIRKAGDYRKGENI